jgi:hypothetical protein
LSISKANGRLGFVATAPRNLNEGALYLFPTHVQSIDLGILVIESYSAAGREMRFGAIALRRPYYMNFDADPLHAPTLS